MTRASKEFVICQLEEPCYEEFRTYLNEWFGSLDCNSDTYNLTYYSRLTMEDLGRDYFEI